VIRKIGSTKDIAVDFRVIAATNVSLKDCVSGGAFRSDLYYRLNVVPLTIPPLRERRKDIVPLCMHFLHYYCKNYGRIKNLSDNVLEKAFNYDWPGNVRELRNFVERIVVMSAEDVIEIKDVPDHMFTNERAPDYSYSRSMGPPIFYALDKDLDTCESEGFSMAAYLERCESRMLEKVLQKYGSTYKAAEVLKMSQPTVVRRKEKYNIGYGTK
jgi:transcriptional regulator with PAS, ATPase and Fis domain